MSCPAIGLTWNEIIGERGMSIPRIFEAPNLGGFTSPLAKLYDCLRAGVMRSAPDLVGALVYGWADSTTTTTRKPFTTVAKFGSGKTRLSLT